MEYRVVLSRSGRDCGRLLAVVGEDAQSMLLCDGKKRPLERPKRKNPRHVIPTNFVLQETDLLSNRALRKALATAGNNSEEELLCQKKI